MGKVALIGWGLSDECWEQCVIYIFACMVVMGKSHSNLNQLKILLCIKRDGF